MYCRYCGTDIGDNDAFCLNCGKPTGEEAKETKSTGRNYNSNQVNLTDILDDTEQQLIGTNLEYYIPKFANIRCFGRSVQWNWASFFFGPFWFVYRKMYKWAAGMLIANFVFITAFGGFFTSILAGVFGNLIYSGHIAKLANQARCMSLESEQQNFIHHKGGTSWLGILAMFAVGAVLFVLLICFAYSVELFI